MLNLNRPHGSPSTAAVLVNAKCFATEFLGNKRGPLKQVPPFIYFTRIKNLKNTDEVMSLGGNIRI